MTRHDNAEIILLTVVPMFSASKISDEFIPALSPDSVKRDDLDKLAKVVSGLVSPGIKREIGEDVIANIMLTIKEEHIDLVIISTHGETGWREAMFGSIAEKVVKQVDCPLLLLRSVKPGVKVDHYQDQALLKPNLPEATAV